MDMNDRGRGMAASVKQRLLNIAHERDEEFEQVLVRFVAERFLHRLSKSRHAESFLLKGALLFVAWEGMPHRVTRDIDLLGFGDPSLPRIAGMMRDVATTAIDDDGISFDIEGMRAEEIRTTRAYHGVRLSIPALLGKARIRLQVDVGFGDAVTPGPEAVEFPSLLGHSATMLRAYPVETVVAEKSVAMIERGMATTRMKDFFDLLHLSRMREFSGQPLVAAISATAARRSIEIKAGPIACLSAEFAEDRAKQAQWLGFCRRLRRDAPPEPLHAVIASLAAFLGPVFGAIADNGLHERRWRPGGPWG
jgi:predicted nucleotidyltransferase component of viral defense system